MQIKLLIMYIGKLLPVAFLKVSISRLFKYKTYSKDGHYKNKQNIIFIKYNVI